MDNFLRITEIEDIHISIHEFITPNVNFTFIDLVLFKIISNEYWIIYHFNETDVKKHRKNTCYSTN